MDRLREAPAVSPSQRRILRFFQEHPQAVETVRGISTWIGLEPKMILEALEGLVSRKWLVPIKTSAVTGYTLTRNERLLGQIQEALKGS